MKRADRIAQNRKFNADRKELAPEQFQQLQELADKHVALVGEAYDHVWSIRKQAMIRSSHIGRYRALETGAGIGGPHTYNPAFAQKNAAAAKQSAKDIVTLTQTELGVDAADWRYSIVSTGYPDGIAKQVLVYFTRQQEPRFFDAEARLKQAEKNRNDALRSFFDQL